MALTNTNTATLPNEEEQRLARHRHHEIMETLFDEALPKMVEEEWLKVLCSKRLPSALTFDIRTLVERFNYISVRLKAFEERFGFQVFDNTKLKEVLERTSFDPERPPLDENYLGWIHERGARTWRELIHPDIPTEGVSNSIESFVVHEAEKLGLDPRTIVNLRAGAERLSFMLTRLRQFEGSLGLGDFTTKDIETFVKDNKVRIDDLKAQVGHYRLGNTPEPASFEVRNFGSREIRILSKEWLEWYAKTSPNQTEGSCIDACARRIVEKLFPSNESKVGLQWQVGTEDQWRNYRGDEEPLFPMEIRITRVTKTVL
jgi:hypothetical protein